MLAIFKREFISYFKSPVGYIALALFSFISGYLFSISFDEQYISMAANILNVCSFFIIIVPIVTMGLLSEDKKRGTDVIFYTAPVKLYKVVLGKYLAAMSLFGIFFLNFAVQMIITKIFGGVVDAPVLTASFTFFSLAFLFVAIGTFASSISDNQIVSAIVTFVIILVIQLLPQFGTFLSSVVVSLMSIIKISTVEDVSKVRNAIESAFNWLDPMQRINTAQVGILSPLSVFYCLSFAFFFLFLTYRILEKKRWSQS